MNNDKIEAILAREEWQIAPLWKRAVAHIIDDLVLTMAALAVFWGQIAGGDLEAALNALSQSWLLVYGLRFIYHAAMARFVGASIGKIVVKVRIIELELLDNPSWQQALKRSAVRLVSEVLLLVPFLFVVANPLRRGLHDIAGGTIVVDFRAFSR